MFTLPEALGRSPSKPLRIAVLSAHADDAEIGAGGTLLRLLAERPHCHVLWAVATGTPVRQAESEASAQALVGRALTLTLSYGALQDGFLPHVGRHLKEWARSEWSSADLVFTPSRDDSHQDHRAMGELAWQSFRGAVIAEYEIPKWDGDLLRRNAYVRLSDDQARDKVDHLRRHFGSQRDKAWYDDDTFRSLMRLRGVECSARWAEAFTCAKLAW